MDVKLNTMVSPLRNYSNDLFKSFLMAGTAYFTPFTANSSTSVLRMKNRGFVTANYLMLRTDALASYSNGFKLGC